MSTTRINAVRGMNDVLPGASAVLERFQNLAVAALRSYGYQQVRTPVVESTAVFHRGIGAVTDIVEKEMYTFTDALNGDSLTLRPENTAGVVRAAIEHSLLHDGPCRLWYHGPMFRHERPQRGRYRQFHQIGAEALGFSGGEVDAELILMANALWRELGIQNVELQLNSLGQPAERSLHRAALITHFEQHSASLDAEAKRRLHLNPLRLLDSKNPDMQAVIEAAPQLMDFLGESSRQHLARVTAVLDANGVAYRMNPRLVRGMDYYNLTVFEFVTTELGSQGTICAGGRYDYLMEQIGGKPTPAVGWAMGVERVLELLKARGNSMAPQALDAYVVITQESDLPMAMSCLEKLRGLGVSLQMQSSSAEGMPGMKAQFKRADSSGANFALVFGTDEVAGGTVTVKALRNAAIAQQSWSLNDLPALASRLQSHA